MAENNPHEMFGFMTALKVVLEFSDDLPPDERNVIARLVIKMQNHPLVHDVIVQVMTAQALAAQSDGTKHTDAEKV